MAPQATEKRLALLVSTDCAALLIVLTFEWVWQPITEQDGLPPAGTSEGPWLDFKLKADPQDRAELAKDIAAMANAVGGTILVGAAESASKLSRYKPIEHELARQLARAYEEAARDRLIPAPVISIAQIPWDAGRVLAINVHPFPGQAVGVANKDTPDCYRFPLRVGSQTVYLTPAQLPMFFEPKLRRIAILLEQLKGKRVHLQIYRESNSFIRPECDLRSVEPLTNTFEVIERKGNRAHRFPLDWVESAFEDSFGWCICLSGRLVGSGDRLNDLRQT